MQRPADPRLPDIRRARNGPRIRSRRRLLARITGAAAAAVVGSRVGIPVPVRAQEPSLLPAYAHAREGWRAALPGLGRRLHTSERVTVHHAGPPSWDGPPNAPAYLRQIQAFHQGPERRWPEI